MFIIILWSFDTKCDLTLDEFNKFNKYKHTILLRFALQLPFRLPTGFPVFSSPFLYVDSEPQSYT